MKNFLLLFKLGRFLLFLCDMPQALIGIKKGKLFLKPPQTAINKDIQIQVHNKDAGKKAAAVEDTNNMDADRIKQCPINLLLTRLKKAGQRIQ